VRKAVAHILTADLAPEDRMKALAPYLDIGRSREEVETVLGPSWGMTFHGAGFCSVYYGDFGKPGLAVLYSPNGKAGAIEYRPREGKSVVLRTDAPIAYPKTEDGKKVP
jgi:hypothetical protein